MKLLQMKEEAPQVKEESLWGEAKLPPFPASSGLFPDLDAKPVKSECVKECEDKKPGKRGHRHQCKKHRSRCPDIPVTLSPMASSPATSPSSKTDFQPARSFFRCVFLCCLLFFFFNYCFCFAVFKVAR